MAFGYRYLRWVWGWFHVHTNVPLLGEFQHERQGGSFLEKEIDSGAKKTQFCRYRIDDANE